METVKDKKTVYEPFYDRYGWSFYFELPEELKQKEISEPPPVLLDK